ncbi:hypothetical protein T265_10838 [Opisthorchis viverrini]|uniref:Uncharacterized protein n=1 Tax=Opisthorchis viverrini TaxID=6198 RepID=A0A074Z0X8_OPIVI|nr:hypothetical protein T265_10838 [Opisthorchis viverrini]KER20666.1 hypothetical protein T265_10838 [Opisthorchis viverrini]
MPCMSKHIESNVVQRFAKDETQEYCTCTQSTVPVNETTGCCISDIHQRKVSRVTDNNKSRISTTASHSPTSFERASGLHKHNSSANMRIRSPSGNLFVVISPTTHNYVQLDVR